MSNLIKDAEKCVNGRYGYKRCKTLIPQLVELIEKQKQAMGEIKYAIERSEADVIWVTEFETVIDRIDYVLGLEE